MASKMKSVEDLLTLPKYKDEIEKLEFESARLLLEELVSTVERGSLPLEKAIAAYERGAELVAHMRGILAGAEAKLVLLKRTGAGEVVESEE